MRAILLSLLSIAATTSASAFSLLPFESPLIDSNLTSPAHNLDLLRRQSNQGCPQGYNNCANLGAAALCCTQSTNCAPDQANHVACCSIGAVCTGTIGGYLTAPGFAATSSTGGVFIPASTTTGTPTTTDGFLILATGSGVVVTQGGAASSLVRQSALANPLIQVAKAGLYGARRLTQGASRLVGSMGPLVEQFRLRR